MCLASVDKKPQRKYGIGYKSVKKVCEGVYKCYDHCDHAGTVSYPLNQWITDPNDGEADVFSAENSYRTGIHLCLDYKAANRFARGAFVTIKLKFRKVTATGGDEGLYGRQVVAREVCNLGEV